MPFRLHHPSMASNSVRYEVVLQVPIPYDSPSVDSTPLSCACLSVTRPRLEEKQCAIVFFRKMSVSRTKTQTLFSSILVEAVLSMLYLKTISQRRAEYEVINNHFASSKAD